MGARAASPARGVGGRSGGPGVPSGSTRRPALPPARHPGSIGAGAGSGRAGARCSQEDAAPGRSRQGGATPGAEGVRDGQAGRRCCFRLCGPRDRAGMRLVREPRRGGAPVPGGDARQAPRALSPGTRGDRDRGRAGAPDLPVAARPGRVEVAGGRLAPAFGPAPPRPVSRAAGPPLLVRAPGRARRRARRRRRGSRRVGRWAPRGRAVPVRDEALRGAQRLAHAAEPRCSSARLRGLRASASAPDPPPRLAARQRRH